VVIMDHRYHTSLCIIVYFDEILVSRMLIGNCLAMIGAAIYIMIIYYVHLQYKYKYLLHSI
jgi:hypothetical protein